MLGERLDEVARHVVPGVPMADIGTDHARLPTTLVERGVVPSAIAVDSNVGPLQRAKQAAASVAGVAVRHGDGLAPLQAGEVATVVLAGIGGARICRLVDAWPHVSTLRRLVVQPNTAWAAVRAWIAARGFGLLDETIVAERGRHYVVLVLDPRVLRHYVWDEDALDFGPILLRTRPAAWRDWLASEHARLSEALSTASDATPAARSALVRTLQRIAKLAG